MSYDPDAEMTADQMDWTAGRKPKQKQWVLKCREVRKYIISHPGITAKRLREDINANSRMIDWLISHKFVHYVDELGLAATPL